MQLVNDINLKLQLDGYGATHYRISISDINNAEWKLLNEDYIVYFTLPNAEGDYTIYYQLKNNYNQSLVLSLQVRYNDVVDTEPPSIPQNLVASSITETSFRLQFDESTDNESVVGYDVYFNDAFKISSTSNIITINNLIPNTEYTIKVRAKDSMNNISDFSSSIVAKTLRSNVSTLVGNVIIAQAFSPSSTIVNVQDGTSVDHCFITLYNKSGDDISLNNAKLYWKYDAYPQWIKTDLSGTIKAKKHFLIRGSKLTGVVEGTTILSDWSIAVPDLDCSVVWNNFVDPNPEDPANHDNRMIQWAIDNNLFYLSSKTGSAYLSNTEHVGDLPNNPWLEKTNLPDYVDLIGFLGKDYENDIAETAPINGVKKSLLYNRVLVNNQYQDTDNNSADFTPVSVMLGSPQDVSALIKSSRT